MVRWLLVAIVVSSCGSPVLYLDAEQTEAIINPGVFVFPNTPLPEYYNEVDTNCVYRRVANSSLGKSYYFLKFEDSCEVKTILKLEDQLKNEDLLIHPQSTDIGRFKIKGDEIFLERFYHLQAPSKRYVREITEGKIKGDTVFLEDVSGNTVYIKSPQYKFRNGLIIN